MAKSGMAGIGRLTMSRRERMVMVEPRGAGMLLITLRAADEVRTAEIGTAASAVEPEMVAIAETIIHRRAGRFDPAIFRDRYQDALRELIEAKLKGRAIAARPAVAEAPVVDLMAALEAQPGAGDRAPKAAAKPKRRASADRRQRNLLLPLGGKPVREERQTLTPAAPRRRKG